MRLDEFIEGIEILKEYYDDPQGYHIGAEHDIFYMYSTDRPLNNKDINKMLELGWFQDDNESDDMTAADYDDGEGWAAYT